VNHEILLNAFFAVVQPGNVCLLAVAMFALSARADDLQKIGEEMSYFYVTPSQERYEHLQSDANRLANSLQKKDNVDLLAAVVIAAASQKHHWEVAGKGEISSLAREIIKGESKVAKYVKDDSIVDVRKLDVWWADFFGTGDSEYLEKILRYAKHPQPGEHASDFMMPAMAAWSFKSNCQQHKAVMAFAKQCLESNAFPTKVGFLKECVESRKPHATTSR
jgi:hypothetical protein